MGFAQLLTAIRSRFSAAAWQAGQGPAGWFHLQAHAAGAKYKRGDLLGASYEIQGVLGVGGFSVVYLALSRQTGATYALKTLRDELAKDAETWALFRKEAKVWIDLERHPNIVRADFITELSGRLYIGMEYVGPGGEGLNSLAGYLLVRQPDLPQSLRWCIQFCHGMEHARSRGIRCHRDVKPANIMITREKTVKITDFGFAGVIDRARAGRELTGQRRKVEQTGFGTPMYMPPEQFLNAARCDERSDIYSLGIIMYQMAARGQLPFALKRGTKLPADPKEAWAEMHRLQANTPVPPLVSPLFPIIDRCLQKEPSLRYQTFADLRSDLEKLLKRQTGSVEKPAATAALEGWELYNKAYSLSTLGNLEEALTWYDKALLLDPGNADAWNNKGVCYRKMGRVDQAIHCFEKALTLDRSNAAALRNMGSSLHATGRLHDALDVLKKAADIDPSNESVWLNLGLVEEKLGRSHEALASFKEYISRNSSHESPQVQYAQKRVQELRLSGKRNSGTGKA